MSPRLRRLAGSAPLAVLGLVLLASGLARERVRCVRAPGPTGAADACTVTSGLPLFQETADIPLAAISDHRFAVHDSRVGRRGATVLIDRAGRELRVGTGDEVAARATYDALHAFFAGDRAEIDITTGPAWWLAVAGGLALAAAAWLLVRGPAAGASKRASAPAADPPPRGARAPVIALVVGGLLLASMAASTLYQRTRGTLQLVCRQRCEVAGGTCMPGGDIMLTLPPGEHEVRVYNPDAPDAPIVHRVVVLRGQVTRFECAL